MSSVDDRETVWSQLFPGNTHTVKCLRPAVLGAEKALELDINKRRRTVWRIDGGAGSDDELRWLLNREYHVIAKGLSGRRAYALARQVERWDAYGATVRIGEVAPPVDYGRSVRCFVKQRIDQDKILHSYYISTLSLPSKGCFIRRYDARGGAEVEQFRNDKSGLGLQARRKRSFCGQQAYLYLTDLAHNLLADFYHHALVDSPFADFGPKRIVRKLLAAPASIKQGESGDEHIDFITQKQFSHDLLNCLTRYQNSY